MNTESSQAQAGVETKSTTETPQGAQSDSLQNPGKEQTLAERSGGARTTDDVDKLIADAKAGRFNQAGDDQAEKSPEMLAQESAAPAEEKTTEEIAAEEAAAKAKKEGDDEEEGEKLPNRVRISDFDDVSKMALQIKRASIKAGKPISLTEAESRAKAALGVSQGETTTEQTAATTDGLPTSLAEAETKLKALVAARTKAFKEDLDFAMGDQLTNEIEALREHKTTLREQGAQQASKIQQSYDAAFNAAEQKAASLYDFVKQPDSPAFKRMQEIDAQLEANGDPLFNAPEKALKIAQMVAADLAIAPKAPGAKPAVKSVATVSTMTAKKPVPPVAGGESRTSTSTTQGGEHTAKIHALRSPAEIEDYIASLTKR